MLASEISCCVISLVGGEEGEETNVNGFKNLSMKPVYLFQTATF